MRVSIAMATYNGERYLQEQLESFLRQTRIPDELVVNDDASSDRTLEVLYSFAKQAPFEVHIYYNDQTMGYSQNFERAISHCNGDIIFLSDQDDVWFPNKIETVLSAFRSEEHPLVVINNAEITDSELNPADLTVFAQALSARLRIESCVQGSATAFRAELVPLILPIPHNLLAYDSWIHRVGLALGRRYSYPQPLQYYRRQKGNVSRYFTNKVRRATLLDRMRQYTPRDTKAACEKRIVVLETLVERLTSRPRKTELCLREKLTVQQVVNKIFKEKEVVTRRLVLLQRSRLRRLAEGWRMYRRGDYQYFSGCMSLIKDLIWNCRRSPMRARKVEITLFLPSLHEGGTERAMINLARGFAERGLKVDLVLAKAEGPYLSQLPKEVRMVDLETKRVLYSLPGLVHYLRRERPKALLAAMNHANVVALWATRLARVPVRVVVSVRSTLSEASTHSPSLRGRLMPYLVRCFYPWADVVVAVSQGVAEDLIRLTGFPRNKVQVIYNPVVTPELFTKAEEPLDHPWFALGEPPVVLSVGRLTEAKDYPTLIQAFALVRKECPARLMILGEGEDRPKLEILVRKLGLEEDVALPGFVENPYKYMKRAAVFVLSSKWEGLPTVLIEALALGTPVVSTDCPSGPVEILQDGEFGKLISVGDVKGLARAILGSFGLSKRQEVLIDAFMLETSVKSYLKVLGIK